eukprot:1655753-Amphidinium_carterae.1
MPSSCLPQVSLECCSLPSLNLVTLSAGAGTSAERAEFAGSARVHKVAVTAAVVRLERLVRNKQQRPDMHTQNLCMGWPANGQLWIGSLLAA